MKYGVHTFLWTQTFDASNLALLPQLKEQGFDGIEIARYQFDDFAAAKIGVEIARNDLECTLCCGLTGELSLISDDSAVRQQALAFIQQAVQMAAELGVKTIVGPLVAPIGHFCGRRRTMDEWHRGVEGLQSLGDILAQHDITLAIEPLNRYQTYFLNTIADALSLCEAVNHPNVGILFDVFHANIEEQDIPSAIRSAERHLKHLHVCENDRGIPGTGHIPWQSVFMTLKELHYDRWVVIESFNFKDQELAARTCTWRNLASTPEAIAYEGLAFLKRYGVETPL
jgi:D-psicose/D-tagatose/L-ribulose 3-epimerase